jgi:hypothetical protein
MKVSLNVLTAIVATLAALAEWVIWPAVGWPSSAVGWTCAALFAWRICVLEEKDDG